MKKKLFRERWYGLKEDETANKVKIPALEVKDGKVVEKKPAKKGKKKND